jgi:GTPase SAR1 family protein
MLSQCMGHWYDFNLTFLIEKGGQERYESITKNFMRDGRCAILVYDITDRESFDGKFGIDHYKSLFEDSNPTPEENEKRYMYILGNALLEIT